MTNEANECENSTSITLYDYLTGKEQVLKLSYEMELNEFALRYLSPWEKSYYSITARSFASAFRGILAKNPVKRRKEAYGGYLYSIETIIQLYEKWKEKNNTRKYDICYENFLKNIDTGDILSTFDLYMLFKNHDMVGDFLMRSICKKRPNVNIVNINSDENVDKYNETLQVSYSNISIQKAKKDINIVWDFSTYITLGIDILYSSDLRSLFKEYLEKKETEGTLKQHAEELYQVESYWSEERVEGIKKADINIAGNSLLIETILRLTKQNKIKLFFYPETRWSIHIMTNSQYIPTIKEDLKIKLMEKLGYRLEKLNGGLKQRFLQKVLRRIKKLKRTPEFINKTNSPLPDLIEI